MNLKEINNLQKLEDVAEKMQREKHLLILICEDDLQVSDVLRRFLIRSGFQVDVVSDFQGARDLLLEKRYDLLLTDQRLPNGSGLDLLHEIHEKNINVKVIMMTGYPDMLEQEEAFKLGVVSYLSKPLELDTLLSKIRRALRG